MILLFFYLLLALTISFLCSLLEATLLSVPRSYVEVLVERGSLAGKRLQQMKDDLNRPLAAILTLNTFAHTLGAAGVGAQATFIWGQAWIGAVSFVVTLLILIISEIIPKTLGARHAKILAPFAACTINGIIKLLWPLVNSCDWISKRLSKNSHSIKEISREEVQGLACLALKQGSLDMNESRILQNLMALRETIVKQVMTPRTVVFTLRVDQTVREVTEGGLLRFARIPILGDAPDDVRGMVHRYELFRMLEEGKLDITLDQLAQPLHAVPELAQLTVVLQTFIKRQEQLFLAVDEYGGIAGVITLEDVLETLLGVEIVDETDLVKDMQELALNRASHRKTD